VSKRLTLLCWLALALQAAAQVPVQPEGFMVFNQLFDAKPSAEPPKCRTSLRGPSLDFAFRFNLGYIMVCRVADFADRPGDLQVYTRVTPQGGSPVLLTETYPLPASLAELRTKLTPRKFTQYEFSFSGGFSVGEGDYRVEVLLIDPQKRTSLRQWDVRAVRKRGEGAITPALAAGTVEPMVIVPWEGKLTREGLRLTVLLDVATLNPDEGRLYTWDRALLLESLVSLLRWTPCRSVRLLAFNLEQQKEIFRKESFDRAAFVELALALQQLELGTVSYRALQKEGPANLLAELVRQESNAKEPADAVIFVGPSVRFDGKMPRPELSTMEKGSTHFFYFEYFPWYRPEFPDSIDYLTKDLHGTVFKIHNAGELGQAIQKMLAQLNRGELEKTMPPPGGTPSMSVVPSRPHN